MKILASTQIQFGGFILNSDDDSAIVQHLTRLIAYTADVMACLSEVCHLLFILLPLMIELYHRVLAVMQAIEEVSQLPALTMQRMAEQWTQFFFTWKLGWSYG